MIPFMAERGAVRGLAKRQAKFFGERQRDMIGLSILLAVVVYVWLARFITKRIKNRTAKYTVIAIFILIPTWDIIPGKLYFNHLCSTEAGVKVYHTVELPAEYWDEQGRARFIRREGSLEFDESMLGSRYTRKSALQPRSSFFRIDRDSYQLIDKQKQLIVGESVNFMYWGGWVSRNLSPHNSAIACGRDKAGYFTDVLKQVFKPINS